MRAFSEGAARRKFLKEAAREGLASAQVTVALEEHLTGPCRTAPTPKDLTGGGGGGVVVLLHYLPSVLGAQIKRFIMDAMQSFFLLEFISRLDFS